jgi:hypothetical protein
MLEFLRQHDLAFQQFVFLDQRFFFARKRRGQLGLRRRMCFRVARGFAILVVLKFVFSQGF